MRKALYAGSFDPPTNGHAYMIREALRLFDVVEVAVAVNPDKKHTFTDAERVALVEQVVKEESDRLLREGRTVPVARVCVLGNEYVVDYAEKNGIEFLIRGVRSVSDFEYERTIRHVNESIRPSVTTVFLMPSKALEEISSSFVRGLVGFLGWREVVPKYVPEMVYRALETRYAKKRWESFCSKVPAGDTSWFHPSEFNSLLAYTEPNRHYHTFTHVLDCLDELDEVRGLCEDPAYVEAAIWFHDVFYDTDPKRTNNEECSASKMAVCIGSYTRGEREIHDMIVATKDHVLYENASSDAALFLDIDLAVLGRSPERYRKYVEGIRKEYAHVSDHAFAEAREKILSALLIREHIYYTPVFQEKYEKQARENLRSELEKLRSDLRVYNNGVVK